MNISNTIYMEIVMILFMLWSLEFISFFFFFFNDTATTEIYTLSLHDALPICDSRRLRDDQGQGIVPARLSCSQHDLQPDVAGRAGRVLPQRGGPSGTWRLLRDRGLHSGASADPARRDRPRIRSNADASGLRGVRLRDPDRLFPPLLDGGWPHRDFLHALSICLAIRAGPDGATCRDDTPRAVERLGARAFHEREQESRLRVGEANLAANRRTKAWSEAGPRMAGWAKR